MCIKAGRHQNEVGAEARRRGGNHPVKHSQHAALAGVACGGWGKAAVALLRQRRMLSGLLAGSLHV